MYSKTILIGRVGSIECKTVGTSKVANISLATSEKWTDKEGNKQENTQWHKLVAWGKAADLAERFVHKGMLLSTDGVIEYKEYEKDGQKKYYTQIKIQTMTFLTKSENTSDNTPVPSDNTDDYTTAGDDDLPF